MTSLSFDSVESLKSALARKAVSHKEVVQSYLERIANAKELNCFNTVCGELALERAAALDQGQGASVAGPLSGIPLGVKDNICTKGVKTTCSSKMLENFVPPYNATVIDRLNSQAALVVGKTNMDEFAMGSSNENSFFGPVKNPWDMQRVPGGTSGGSAAAVAAGLVPVALGSDTGGSVRQPASYCGVTGFKPTYGRVSRFGLVAYASSLDQIGPVGRSMADCAALLSAVAGVDHHDSTSVDVELPNLEEVVKRSSQDPSLTGVRIGIPKEYFIDGIARDVKTSVKASLDQLQKFGAELVEVSLPHTELALAAYYVIAPAEASSNLARYDGVKYGFRAAGAKTLEELYVQTRSEGFGWEVKRRILIGTYVLSSGYIDAYYHQAQKVRRLIADDFSRAFGGACDLIVSPTAPNTAFKIGEKVDDPLSMYLEDIFTIPVNLAGLPAASIPCGFDSQRLPIGLQLIGKAWDEGLICKVAGAFQATTDWHKQTPPASSK